LLPAVPDQAKSSLPICLQTALAPRWRTSVVPADPVRRLQPGAAGLARSTSRVCVSISRRMTWRLEMLTPMACSSNTRRSIVTWL